jgi:DNA primase
LFERLLSLAPLDRTEVVNYLRSRRLLEAANSDKWGALPADIEEQGRLRETLLADCGAVAWADSGLAGMDTPFTSPQHQIVIPWRDPEGRIYTIQRRCLDANKPAYLTPKGRPLKYPYGIDHIVGAPPEAPLAIVEGAMDVLAARQLNASAGLDRVVLGIPGAQTWRPEWSEYAKGRDVVLALDADQAGDRGVVRIHADLLKIGARGIYRARPRAGKDWAECFTEHS